MGGVSRYFSKVSGSGVDLTLLMPQMRFIGEPRLGTIFWLRLLSFSASFDLFGISGRKARMTPITRKGGLGCNLLCLN